MSKLLERFNQLLHDKKILNVVNDDFDHEYPGDKNVLPVGDADHDGGAVKINFTDGSFITVSASEWGSVQYYGRK